MKLKDHLDLLTFNFKGKVLYIANTFKHIIKRLIFKNTTIFPLLTAGFIIIYYLNFNTIPAFKTSNYSIHIGIVKYQGSLYPSQSQFGIEICFFKGIVSFVKHCRISR